MLSRNDLLLEGIGFCLKAPAPAEGFEAQTIRKEDSLAPSIKSARPPAPAGGFVIKIAGYA